MLHALECVHVDAQLGDHYSSQQVINAWNRPETLMLFAIRSELGVDTGIKRGDVAVELLQARELHLQNESVMLFHFAFER